MTKVSNFPGRKNARRGRAIARGLDHQTLNNTYANIATDRAKGKTKKKGGKAARQAAYRRKAA